VAIEPIGVYNEPSTRPRGDRVPKAQPFAPARLGRLVRARLELERELRICANRPASKPLRFTDAHAQVLLAMLTELDSPKSASLRARAAAAVGPMGLTKAAPTLRKMALDQQEDEQTRLNAAASYVMLRKRAAADDVSAMLESEEPLMRTTVYVSALRSGDSRLIDLAEARYQEEDDPSVRRQVARRVPTLVAEAQTRDDA
jgi:hypothetical protein